MSARAAIHAMLPICDSPAEADTRAQELDARLDAHRADSLNEGITCLQEWRSEISELRAPGLEFAISVLQAVRDDGTNPVPDFFRPGRTYAREHHGQTVTFVVTAVSTSPDGQRTVAHGWRTDPYSDWEPFDSDDLTGWIDVTGEVTR